MGYWIFMFFMSMLLPVTMLGFGSLFKKSAPGKINSIYGYRTNMSMKNQDTWVFAHQYCGNLWFKWGKVTLLISAVVMIFVFGKSEDVVGGTGSLLVLLQLIPVIGVIFPTEKALKENFDAKGNRKIQK